jgi:hypothetical protein
MKKVCTKCKSLKSESEFYTLSSGYKMSECKECIKVRVEIYRKKNKEKNYETKRRYMKKRKKFFKKYANEYAAKYYKLNREIISIKRKIHWAKKHKKQFHHLELQLLQHQIKSPKMKPESCWSCEFWKIHQISSGCVHDQKDFKSCTVFNIHSKPISN